MKPFAYLLLLLSTACSLSAADLPVARHKFIVIAHRGDHTRAHENTLTAFRHAAEAGIDYVEIDVRRTSDGQYVLMHDGTVDRMTDGHGSISQMTLAQIRSLKVRDLKRPQIAPDQVPTLQETLAFVKNRINIYLDFKAGDRAVVADMIRKAGVQKQLLVYDDIEAVPEWHRAAPELPLIVSPPKTANSPTALVDFAKRAGIEVLDDNWTGYTRDMVQSAEKAGIRVWPDIQSGEEGPAYFRKVTALGFTGVQSDHPEDLIAWLKEQRLR